MTRDFREYSRPDPRIPELLGKFKNRGAQISVQGVSKKQGALFGWLVVVVVILFIKATFLSLTILVVLSWN